MITLTQEETRLKITLDDKEALAGLITICNSNDELILYEMMEISRYIGNGWYCNQNIGLTQAPNICYDQINPINDIKDMVTKDAIEKYDLAMEYADYMEELDFAIKSEWSDNDIAFISFAKFLEEKEVFDEYYDFEKVYWYPNYMVSDWIKELLDNGFVYFNLAINNGNS